MKQRKKEKEEGGVWFQDVPCKWGRASWILLGGSTVYTCYCPRRRREGGGEGREHFQFIPQAILSIFLEKKWAWWQTDRQTDRSVSEAVWQSVMIWTWTHSRNRTLLNKKQQKKVCCSCRISMQMHLKWQKYGDEFYVLYVSHKVLISNIRILKYVENVSQRQTHLL